MNHEGAVIARAPGPVWRPDAGFVQDHHNVTPLKCVSPVRRGSHARRNHPIGERRAAAYASRAPGFMSGPSGSRSPASVTGPLARPAEPKNPQPATIHSRADGDTMANETRTAE